MSQKQIIYVDVKGYAEKVWHPVTTKHQHGSCYLVLESSTDPEHEYWQFESGDVVCCEMKEFDGMGESRLIAVLKCECNN